MGNNIYMLVLATYMPPIQVAASVIAGFVVAQIAKEINPNIS